MCSSDLSMSQIRRSLPDRHITLASEIGVYDYKDEDVVEKGRLSPGEMLAVDTKKGEARPDKRRQTQGKTNQAEQTS